MQMRHLRRLSSALLILCTAALFSALSGSVSIVDAAPDVFASPINAGCVKVTPLYCKIHVDPFTIQAGAGQRLVAFQLRANGELMYDYRTDVSNPPGGNYSPSLVKKDFAARCGRTYTINLLARDTGDSGFLNAGQVENVACPAGFYPPDALYIRYLPYIDR